jgi:histidinol dehydrogenase
MMRRVDVRGAADGADFRSLVARATFDVDDAAAVVGPVCDAVRRGGYDAVVAQTERIDGVRLTEVAVGHDRLARALRDLDADVRAGLVESTRRLRATCAAELPVDIESDPAPGARVLQRNVPVDRVGVYAPAAKAPLISSVVMNVVPAQVAGVREIALASPPLVEHGGLPHPGVLAAAELLGVHEVYAVGASVAFPMLAYGFDDPRAGCCRPVDMLAGPANVYGVAAKRLLRSVVAIDSEAGPTEIAVLADDSANPSWVAADLVSQAEHDVAAAAVLVTDSVALADAVEAELARIVPAAKHSERIGVALRATQSVVVIVDDIDQGLRVVDGYAAEHLEIHTREAARVARRVRNAGAVFVGGHSPVSLGDYCAGSNHVLPTGRCACRSSGLSVRTFLKTMQVVEYTADALADAAPAILALAEAEDLPAHGDAVRARVATGRRGDRP